MTTNAKQVQIAWYRSPIDSGLLKELHQRSDFRAWLQTLFYLGLLVLTGGAALYGVGRLPLGVVALLVFLYGTFNTFIYNAAHELGHGTVFKTKFLNGLFLRIFAFLRWMNFETFNESHRRHHRFTLHAPDDLEVILPMKATFKDFFSRVSSSPATLSMW